MRPESAVLRHYLQNQPLGPLVLAGPDCCGSSALLKQALRDSDVQQVLWCDLDKYKGSFYEGFVQSSGFNIVGRLWNDLAISKSGGTVDAIEAQLCLDRIRDVFYEHLRQPKGERGPPAVVVLDQVKSLSAELDSFLDFAEHVTDSGAAHFVVVTRTPLALRLDRVKPAFAARRRRVLLDYLPPPAVQGLLEARGVEKPAAQAIAAAVGGQFVRDASPFCACAFCFCVLADGKVSPSERPWAGAASGRCRGRVGARLRRAPRGRGALLPRALGAPAGPRLDH